MIRALALLVCLTVAPWAVNPESSRSAKKKLERIGEEKMWPGESIVFTEDEVDSCLRWDCAADVPAGLEKPLIRMEPGRVTGTATVDFLQWDVANGASPGIFLSWLLRGKRPVQVTGRYTSADGYGQTDIEEVRISGVPISGGAVTFLIENLVRPRYPSVVVGRRTPLGLNLKQVRIERGRAVVVAR